MTPTCIDGDAGGSRADGNRAGHEIGIATVQIDEFDFVGAGFGYSGDAKDVVDGDGAGGGGSGERQQGCRARRIAGAVVWENRKAGDAVVGEALLLVTLIGKQTRGGQAAAWSERADVTTVADRDG